MSQPYPFVMRFDEKESYQLLEMLSDHKGFIEMNRTKNGISILIDQSNADLWYGILSKFTENV